MMYYRSFLEALLTIISRDTIKTQFYLKGLFVLLQLILSFILYFCLIFSMHSLMMAG
jgi:hypothetical protein